MQKVHREKITSGSLPIANCTRVASNLLAIPANICSTWSPLDNELGEVQEVIYRRRSNEPKPPATSWRSGCNQLAGRMQRAGEIKDAADLGLLREDFQVTNCGAKCTYVRKCIGRLLLKASRLPAIWRCKNYFVQSFIDYKPNLLLHDRHRQVVRNTRQQDHSTYWSVLWYWICTFDTTVSTQLVLTDFNL